MNRYRWLVVRLIIVAFWLYSGLTLRPSDVQLPPWPLLFVFVASALYVRFSVGREYSKLPVGTSWLRPSWLLSPFLTGQSMQFFHLGGVSFLAAGTAMLFSAGWHLSGMASFLFAFGGGMYLGVWWFVWARRDRFLGSPAGGT